MWPADFPAGARPLGLELRVRDLELELAFWRDLLGLSERGRDSGRVWLAPAGGGMELVLRHSPKAHLAQGGSAGLYHLALLVPSREALGKILIHLAQAKTKFVGFADHGVSEALYLSDPEGNGLELYRDRPSSEWRHLSNGDIWMTTEPIDLEGVAQTGGKPGLLDSGTVLGHLHLAASDLAAMQAFYREGLGLGQPISYAPGATFLSTGGYHHHLGINSWGNPSRRDPEATGILAWSWTSENWGDWAEAAGRRGLEIRPQPVGFQLTDPLGLEVWLR